MKNKGDKLVLIKVLKKIAPKIGAKVLVEPKWGIAGQIEYKSGVKRYFRYSSLDLNRMGASEIARDKDFANFFMGNMGYSVIEGRAFLSDHWAEVIGSDQKVDAAYEYAKSLGLPVVVKPNSRSHGVGVSIAHNKKEFYKAMKSAFKEDRVALVQRFVSGRDYRVVVLDNKIIAAYERIPLNVVGDGKSKITKLIDEKFKEIESNGRDASLNKDDERIISALNRQKLTPDSVLEEGRRVYLLSNSNLSAGGDAVDVGDKMHPTFKKLTTSLTKDMGLRLCGVDLMIDGDISKKPGKYWILEVNSAPGFDNYYKIGRKQQKIVEDFYMKILKSMEK